MKSNPRMLVLMSSVLISIVLFGCSKSEQTGIILEASIMPTYNGADTMSVDAVQSMCTSTIEYFASHGATVTFNARLKDPNSTYQESLTVERYTVTYTAHADSPTAPVLQVDVRNDTILIPSPSGAEIVTVEASVMFVDLIRKGQYAAALIAGISNYTAAYTFEGRDQYDVPFTITTNADFEIGDFINCP